MITYASKTAIKPHNFPHRPAHQGVHRLPDEAHGHLQGDGRLCDAGGLREHDGSAGAGSPPPAAVEHRYSRHAADAGLLCAVHRGQGTVAGGPVVPPADHQFPAGPVAAHVQDAGRPELIPQALRRLLPHTGQSSHPAAEAQAQRHAHSAGTGSNPGAI